MSLRVGTASFLSRSSVTEGTGRGYERELDALAEYRVSLPEHLNPGEFFELCTSKEQRAQELILFYKYLYEEKGFRNTKVAKVSTALVFSLAMAWKETGFLRT